LIVREDLHPAIQNLLLDAASEIHSAAGVFQKAGQFPAAEQVDLPLSRHAIQYYKSGLPFLMRSLPFWLAAMVRSWFVLLIPIAGIAYPLLRAVPAVYGWSMRRRIFNLYGELKLIEAELEAGSGHMAHDLRGRLDRLEARANRMHVPLGFAHLLYGLRVHINLVRTRLQDSPQEDLPRENVETQ
jgi:hypothetical protein